MDRNLSQRENKSHGRELQCHVVSVWLHTSQLFLRHSARRALLEFPSIWNRLSHTTCLGAGPSGFELGARCSTFVQAVSHVNCCLFLLKKSARGGYRSPSFSTNAENVVLPDRTKESLRRHRLDEAFSPSCAGSHHDWCGSCPYGDKSVILDLLMPSVSRSLPLCGRTHLDRMDIQSWLLCWRGDSLPWCRFVRGIYAEDEAHQPSLDTPKI